MTDRKVSYFAVDRGIFDHYLFKENRRFTRLEAWLWLIGRAAWKARARHEAFGLVHLERGQIATTLREMAGAWRWPKANVERFIERLAAEAMINWSITRTGKLTGTSTGTLTRYPITLLSICNYDKFNRLAYGAKSGMGQQPGGQTDDEGEECLPFQEFAAAIPTNQSNHRVLEAAEKNCNRTKPVHKAKSGDGRRQWFDHGSFEWNAYARECEEVTGAKTFPIRYIGGRGNWFLLSLAPARRKRS